MSEKTYGSEHHLFRYCRKHPQTLDAAIQRAVGPSSPIDWLYPANLDHFGSEPEGLNFIP